jgi:acyl carrier protein
MAIETIVTRIRAYILTEFLDNQGDDLTEDTPLLDLGVLDSFRILKLLTFADRELGVRIPLEDVSIGDMKDITSIAGMLARRSAAAAPVGPHEAAS